jgi:hypothetical protein
MSESYNPGHVSGNAQTHCRKVAPPGAQIEKPSMLLAEVLLLVTRAAQPAASAVAPGTLASITDEDNIVEQSDGSTWSTFAAAGTPGPAGPTGPTGPTGAGSGDVVGPASAVNNQIPLFNLATGKLIKDSGQTIASVLASAAAAAPALHSTSHKSGGTDAVKLDELAAPTDITTLNATTGQHGLLPKLPGGTTTFLRGDGSFATPAGAGDVVGPSTSIDSEIGLFSATTGKLIKRATGTGIVRVSSGVYGTPGAVALASEVSGDLPLSNLAQSSAASRLLGRGSASGAGDYQEITLGTGISLVGTVLTPTLPTRAITFVISNGGSVIATGVQDGDLSIPFACTITGVRLLADQSGSIVVNIWKDTYANYPPTVADKITASAPPTISTAVKSEDTTLTGWTTAIAAGSTLRFNVDSVTTLPCVTVILTVTG